MLLIVSSKFGWQIARELETVNIHGSPEPEQASADAEPEN